MAEAVPPGGPLSSGRPLRHHVVVGEQDAIEGLGGSDEFVTILARKSPGRSMRRRPGPRCLRDCASLPGLRGLRSPEFTLLIAGRKGLTPDPRDDVEIERSRSVYMLNVVDDPHGGDDAEAIERGFVGQKNALVVGAVAEKFDRQRLALGVYAARSFSSHPASRSSRSASRRLLRTASGVSPTGFA